MSARNTFNPHQLKQLERVLKTRVASAERTLQKELDSLRRIRQELEERRAKLSALNDDQVALLQYLSGESSSSDGNINAKDYQQGLNRRYWINYDLQRESYYLDLTVDEETEQLVKVNSARKVYKAAQIKCDVLNDQLLKHAKQQNRFRAISDVTGAGL